MMTEKLSEEIPRAIDYMKGIHAALALMIERKKPVSAASFHEMAIRLKHASEILEELAKEKPC